MKFFHNDYVTQRKSGWARLGFYGLCGIILSGMAVSQVIAATKLNVLLDWYVNPDHAPLILAKEMDFFEAEGLDVTLTAPSDPSAPPRLVAAGQGDVAVSYQPQLYLQQAEGIKTWRFGTLVSTPLTSLAVLKSGPIKSLADLKGKRIGYSVAGMEESLLKTMLAKAGLSINDVTLVNVNFSLTPSLLSHQVEAVIGAFRNFELTQMELAGEAGLGFYPEEQGVPPYDELIYITRQSEAKAAWPQAFLRAVEMASLYQLNHPKEAWEIIIKAYPSLNDELNRRAYQDTLPRFAASPAAFDSLRYQRFADYMQAAGLVKTLPKLSSYAHAP